MNRPIRLVLPTACALALVLFAALAPAPRAREARLAATSLTGCDASSLAGTDAARTIPAYTGVLQPFDGTSPVASCSLAVATGYYSGAWLDVVAWDPLALAPDLSTISLRTRNYDASEMLYNHARAVYAPPVVTRPVPGVAEPGPAMLAINYVVLYSYNTQDVRYWTDGPAGMPAAYSYTGTTLTPLAGPHPVLAATFCPGDGTENLRVLQSVTKTTTLLGFEAYEYLQRFRVPMASTVEWVELAFGYNANVYPPERGWVAIIDGDDMPAPSAALPQPIFQADFYNAPLTRPTWATHFLTAAPVILQPHHDYWLLARSVNKYPLYVRDLTGNEGPEFLGQIGPFYSRSTATGTWTPGGMRALSFRLLGEPGPPPLAVEPGLARGLRLGVEPNPARGSALVRWSGARGAIRLEVLDERGRRVASHEATGAGGSWSWRGNREDGTPFAPGVYFVRAVDGAGVRGAARVVLIR